MRNIAIPQTVIYSHEQYPPNSKKIPFKNALMETFLVNGKIHTTGFGDKCKLLITIDQQYYPSFSLWSVKVLHHLSYFHLIYVTLGQFSNKKKIFKTILYIYPHSRWCECLETMKYFNREVIVLKTLIQKVSYFWKI